MAYAGPIAFPVIEGGTGDSSFTAFAPVCGGTTTTGAMQSASTGISTSGFVLTSNGASSLPSWQATGSGGSGDAKAWANFSINGSGNPTLVNSFNVTSVTGTQPTFTVTLTTGLSNSNYVILTNLSGSGGTALINAAITNSTTFTLNAPYLNTTIYFAVFGS